MGLYKSGFVCYNNQAQKEYGPVVQSVSTPACHAGGRRFESVRGRQKIKPIRKDGFYFLLPNGLENKIRPAGGRSSAGQGPGRSIQIREANLQRVRSGCQSKELSVRRSSFFAPDGLENKMQQSGGLLPDAGSTASAPSFLSVYFRISEKSRPFALLRIGACKTGKSQYNRVDIK